MREDVCALIREPIDLNLVHRTLCDSRFGAQLVFTGVVRESNEGRRVFAVNYEAYEPLARKVMLELASEVRLKIDQPIRVVILHRLGELPVGEVSTVIGVATPHRGHCYDASRYLIENLKTRMPIWKEERYVNGESKWLDGEELKPSNSSGSPGGR